ncbi:proline-rich protein 2-like [Pezoporus flaviventris]|uniref:proline-rich protein 2-like n=1 Tax=Pezoporus flaviventris TaxID=889875 RepID=UPI002AAF639A|nr:proline-rich protein 2-like [Pezoporus flaviventris]
MQTQDSTAQLHAGSTHNYRLEQQGRGARPAVQRCGGTRGRGDTGTAPAPERSFAQICVTSGPCTCYRPSPSRPRAPGGPRARRPEGCDCLKPRDSQQRDREKRGAGRSTGSPPGPAPLSIPTETGSAAGLLVPVRPGPRPPQPRSLAPETGRSSARSPPAPAARLIRAALRPPPPQGVGPAGPRGAGGRVRAWRRAAAGPEQAASLERPVGLPSPQAHGSRRPPVPSSPAPTSGAGLVPPALLTEACESREPRGKGRTAAKPETDTAAILGTEAMERPGVTVP